MKKLILILSILFVITNCNNDDNNIVQQIDDTEPDHEIVAKWKLTKFEHFGGLSTYNGEILWTFNSNETVNVVIADGTDVSGNLPLNISGIYSFTIESNADQSLSVITLDGTGYLLELADNQLILLFGSLDNDGMELTFELIE